MTDLQEAPEKSRPNPSAGQAENDLFEIWKVAPPEEREKIELRLMAFLRVHAAKVCWMVLHLYDPHLIDEIAQDAVMDLDSFEERSAFSTWFHSRATFRCRTQLKQNIQRKEVPMPVGGVESMLALPDRASAMETQVIVNELLDGLSSFERSLVELKVYEGLPDADVAENLGFTREWIQTSWSRLRKKLKEKYNGVV